MNIPTAEELLTNILSSLDCYETISFLKSEDGEFDLDNLIALINIRTKLHLEAALKAIIENAEVICDSSDIFQSIDKDSIINAYPLSNIK